MTGVGMAAVGIGAALGAWARWWLGLALNSVLPTLPLGTLVANLIGGLLMGVAMAAMDHYQTLSPELRLFVTTGFLGALTTFSTFSAEATTLIEHQQYGWLVALVAAHVVGAIAMTIVGLVAMRFVLGG